MSVQDDHELRQTLSVDVVVPGHDERVTTSLFSRTRLKLIAREGGCYVCARDEKESGKPLEAHHHPIERSFAEMIDWELFARDCQAGLWGPHAQAFDWTSFFAADPIEPMVFVDDMTVNGMLLCKDHHTRNNEGIHTLPFPVWIAQKYGREGYKFSEIEIIHHTGQEPEEQKK